MAELCRAFGVSRKTAYKWVARYKDEARQASLTVLVRR
jgi:transposase-like protein